jgi:biopolymer transport protein TolR
MAMSLGHNKAEMNVTPMIDILLVLIIIFLVVTPQLSTGFHANIPQDSDASAAAPTPLDDIVITVVGNGTVRLNREVVAVENLEARLKEVFKHTANHVIFVRGEKGLDFTYVAQVIDIAKGAGLDRVALMK